MGVLQTSGNHRSQGTFQLKLWLGFLMPAGIVTAGSTQHRQKVLPQRPLGTDGNRVCYGNARVMLGVGSCPMLSEAVIIAPL